MVHISHLGQFVAPMEKKFCYLPTPHMEVYPPHLPNMGAKSAIFVRNAHTSWYNAYTEYEERTTSWIEVTHWFQRFWDPNPTSPRTPSFQKKRCNSWMWRLLLYNMVIFFMRCCVLRTLALSNWAHHAPWRSWASVKKDFRVISTPFTKIHPPHSPKVGATYESFIQNDAIGWYNVYMQYKVRVTR